MIWYPYENSGHTVCEEPQSDVFFRRCHFAMLPFHFLPETSQVAICLLSFSEKRMAKRHIFLRHSQIAWHARFLFGVPRFLLELKWTYSACN